MRFRVQKIRGGFRLKYRERECVKARVEGEEEKEEKTENASSKWNFGWRLEFKT